MCASRPELGAGYPQLGPSALSLRPKGRRGKPTSDRSSRIVNLSFRKYRLGNRTQRVIAMLTTFSSQFATADAISADVPALSRVANQHETTFEQSETGDETVEISPLDSVKRHGTERHGVVAESIYVPARTSIRIHYRAHMH